MTTFKLSAATQRTSGFAEQAIADTASHTGDAIDNATNKDLYLSVEALYQYATAPTAAKTVALYLLYSFDGTNYEEVHARALIASLSPAADTDAHRRVLVASRQLLPFAFKLHAINVDTGQQITLTLNVHTHNEEAVT